MAVNSAKQALNKIKQEFEEINKLRDGYLELQASKDKIQTRREDYRANRESAELEVQEITSAEQSLKELQPKLKEYDSLKEKKDMMDAASVTFASFQAKQKEMKRLEQQVENEAQAVQHVHERAAKVDEKKQEVDNINKQIEEEENERQRLESLDKEVHARVESITQKGKELAQKKQQVEELGEDGPCPVCTRPLGKFYETVTDHYDDEVNALRADFKKNQEEKKKIGEKIEKIKLGIRKLREQRDAAISAHQSACEAMEQQKRANERLTNLQSQKELLVKEIADLGEVKYEREIHDQIKKQFDELTQLRQDATRFQERVSRREKVENEISRFEKLLGELAQDLKGVEEKTGALGFDPEKYDSTKKRLEEKTAEYDEARDLLSAKQTAFASLEKDVERLEKELAEQKAQRLEIEETRKEITYLDALEDHFAHFRLELAGRLRPLIAGRASELLRLTTDSRYSVLELDADYNISLYDDTTAHPIARFSGGEQDLANLCLRIAISQVVAERSGGSPINFIVLDEIFGSQDEERRGLILTALQHLSSQFRQIFIITHIEEIKDVLPVLVAVEEKNAEESSAVMM